MRTTILAFILLPLITVSAHAQLNVNARLVNGEVMQYEPVTVRVHIKNNTSQTVELDSDDKESRLFFEVEQGPGSVVGEIPGGEPYSMTIEPHGEVVKVFNLLARHDLRNTGPYSIRLRVDWGGKRYVSSKMYLDVVPGLDVDTIVTDVPGGGYMAFNLRTLNRHRKEYLFLRIEDRERGLCHGVFNLGRVIRVKKPKLVVDDSGRVHVLQQSGPQQYTHTVLSSEGVLIDRESYLGSGSGMDFGRTLINGLGIGRSSIERDEMLSEGILPGRHSTPVPLR